MHKYLDTFFDVATKNVNVHVLNEKSIESTFLQTPRAVPGG
jgi:hypothetical protein